MDKRKFALKDLPKQLELLLQVDSRSKNNVILKSIAIGTDDELPVDNSNYSGSSITSRRDPFRRGSSRFRSSEIKISHESLPFTTHSHKIYENHELEVILPISSEPNLPSSLITVCSETSSNYVEDYEYKLTKVEEIQPCPLKHVTQDHLDDAKNIQILELIDSCQKYSEIEVTEDFAHDPIKDDREEKAENFLRSHSETKSFTSHPHNFIQNTSTGVSEVHDEQEKAHPDESNLTQSSRSNVICSHELNAKREPEVEETQEAINAIEKVSDNLDQEKQNLEAEVEEVDVGEQDGRYGIEANEAIIVGTVLTDVHEARKNKISQNSIQTVILASKSISVQTAAVPDKAKSHSAVQTQIHFSIMEQILMDRKLNMDVYTQTKSSPDSNVTLASSQIPLAPVKLDFPLVCKFSNKEAQAEAPWKISELTQLLGHSILDAFGRKCLSMHNISDWSASRYLYLCNFEGNFYRRDFTHAETMLYTVMCQDTFQPTPRSNISVLFQQPPLPLVSCNSSSSIIENDDSRLPSTSAAVDENFETSTSTSEIIKNYDSNLVLSASHNTLETKAREYRKSQGVENFLLSITDDKLPQSDLESISSEDSEVNGSNDGSDSGGSGYDADDELSNDDDNDSVLLEDMEELVQNNSSIELQNQQGSPNQGTSPRSPSPPPLPYPGPPVFVSHVLSNISGSVIRRIIKRGKLKRTMSDFQ